ncbi:MAG: sulfide/dihydroorotate dehydrogenase-like FAD/NAD-binding protein [Deltaproteobacteria bacterium]|nr:sulfide/dihydroorotate dehydrogenase-like FAD/NAD-binding protein [Deltaproteobacteria bacterium]
MFKIIEKTELAPKIVKLVIEAPQVAKKALPGQFVMIMAQEEGERIPLTIAGRDAVKGTVDIVFMEIGKTTALLGKMKEGDFVTTLLGPLGTPSRIEKFGTVVCVGGGVGVTAIYPIARGLKEAGNLVIGIVGARKKDLVIFEKEMESATIALKIGTDDGSYGIKGFVTDILKEMLEAGTHIDLVYAVGPLPMMRAVSNLTKTYGVKTLVSLNPIMVDATGMCGACRVTVGGVTKLCCVEGPDFDGHLVDFDELAKRQRSYLKEEKEIMKMNV